MVFSADEIERYARHLVLTGVGGPGQQRLSEATVVVVGAGGLGAPVIAYLAAAGVGCLRIVDDDDVSLSNLQRQIIHSTATTGIAKVESACGAVAALNPHVAVDMRQERLTAANAAALIEGATVVVDGADNPATRYVLADACEAAQIPLVEGAVSAWDGHVTVLMPYAVRADGRPFPRYRDIFGDAPAGATEDECVRLGVLGVVTGVIGTVQAAEAVKLILGEGEPLAGRLLLYDARGARFETITV